MATIKIGADEIILWMRKNSVSKNTRNDDLGKKICELICNRLNGQKIPGADNTSAHWETTDGAFHIGPFELPKTAEQYTLDTSKLQDLYDELAKW
jgi:hypothetical protein